MAAQYSVGIDLGTTNSVLACLALGTEGALPEVLPVPQLTAPSTVEARTILPSFLYLGTPEEVEQGVCKLPWASPPQAVGVPDTGFVLQTATSLSAPNANWANLEVTPVTIGQGRQAVISPSAFPAGDQVYVRMFQPAPATAAPK